MLIDFSGKENQSDYLSPGYYRCWAGKPGDSREEIVNLVRLLRSLRSNCQISAEILPESDDNSSWLGEAELNPTSYNLPNPRSLVLYTSGSTGVPKSRMLSAEKLSNWPVKGVATDNWILTYNHYRWAGISVIMHALTSRCQLAIPKSLSAEDIVDSALEFRCTHISLTPSMFRQILIRVDEAKLKEIPIRQVTFGGEVAGQNILDTTKALWNCRTTHIYALTEFGDICSASDGLAGYPKHKFDGPRFDFTEEGELIIDGKRTGDFWAKTGDRYLFEGRAQDIVTIGGENVSMSKIEQIALEVANVKIARCHSVKNALLNNAIVLEYVGKIDNLSLMKELRSRLPKVACPSLVKQVDSLELAATGKLNRVQG